MNLPNKITVCRIGLAVLLLLLLILPVEQVGLIFPKFLLNGQILIDSKYFICGALFIVASVTDFLDGFIARKYDMVTDTGKVLDAIADKLLVNGVLILLAYEGFISVVVPVVIVSRDICVDSIKMMVGSKVGAVGASALGKIKTICMLVGVSLVFFYNLPFELWNIRVADMLILIATVLSVVSGVEYFIKNKQFITDNKKEITE
ncbi:MAG: CDP-diacylglycerol--glycerol-3-phosphate 3-phosphatidyltransferase [Bacilli bacterium]